jgi:putative nucleotidyltransferase with HDIG domain
MNTTSKMERLLGLVESLSRPGTDKVVEYIKGSNFSRKHGGSTHHKYPGGLVDHCLEVYENMKEKSKGLDISEETIIICSLFHDLGKVKAQNEHPEHSLAILDKCGFELTDEERLAIGSHHTPNAEAFNLSSVPSILKRSDMLSAGTWKSENPRPGITPEKKLWNDLLTIFSKI